MVDVSYAISTARNYLESVFAIEALRNIRLEEVGLSGDDKFWTVTFSFDRSSFGGTVWSKDYKLVKVDAESGQARGIQIRELV